MPKSIRIGPGFIVRPRPNGMYQLRVTHPTTRKRHSWALGTDSQVSAIRQATELYDRFLLGKWSPWDSPVEDGVSIEDALKRFERSKRGNIAPATIRDYKWAFLQLCEYAGIRTSRSPAAITPEDLSSFIYDRGLSDASTSSYFRKLSAVLNWMVKNGLLESSPLATVPRPQDYQSIPDGIPPEDLAELIRQIEQMQDSPGRRQYYRIESANPDWLKNAMLLMVYVGLRPSEAARLRWRDVDWRGFITVRGRTKTRTERTVTMIPAARRLLESIRHERCEWVLTNHTGTEPISVRYTSKQFRRAREAAGLPANMTLYSTRHTFAREYRMRGGALHMLKDEMGHKRIETTMKYGNINPKERADYTRSLFAETDPPKQPKNADSES